MGGIERETFRKSLAELFSGYRAEWLRGAIFDLFTEPSYFPQLTTSHPCFLVGGRGTGKTTALRCLSYMGREALHGEETDVNEWPYFGVYYRVNTNRVRAFRGPELSEDRWTRVFGHYINLAFSELVLQFLEWYALRAPTAPRLAEDSFRRIAVALNLGDVVSHAALCTELELSRLRFEAAINNVADEEKLPPLSLQGAPVDIFIRELRRLPQFENKPFFFLVDEYENLDASQQRVLNTLIKHCGDLYSFKVSVRELGFRERATLNAHEQLTHPADYKLINITDELEGRFGQFAAEVCNRRLQRAVKGQEVELPDIRDLLPELTVEEESLLLGVEQATEHAMAEFAELPRSSELHRRFFAASPLERFVLVRRAQAERKSLDTKLKEVLHNPARWDEQYDNYKFAYLFSIRRGKRGIRKYFAGWRVFCLLAAGNIRYLLELVDEALMRHLDAVDDPLTPVDVELQTKAAQHTGEKNLRELEGLSLSGAKLTRLLLSLGRVFQVMAEDPIGHTPEVNQFHLAADVAQADLRGKVDELLAQGIMHLALLRYVGSKLQDQTDVRQFDYTMHPIFAPFFDFSYRRKRKIELADKDLCALIENPTQAIGEILSQQNRSAEEPLPDQMGLFADYYALPHQ